MCGNKLKSNCLPQKTATSPQIGCGELCSGELGVENKVMRKKSELYHFHMGSQRLLVLPCAVLLMLVYVASAAPKKSAPPQEAQVSEKITPSLFAPSAAPAQRKSPAASQPPVSGSVPRAGAIAEDWTMDLEVPRKPTEDWEEAYYRYFKQHQVHPRTIRMRVRGLTEQKESDLQQVIGLLRAAMRAGQIQPWMYEALALAMRIEKMPPAEIERVLLSSADFATSARQVIFLAEYMDRLGYRQRALELLREVTLRDPAADLAYAKALEIAIYLDDADALQWATLGVLSQEWPRENATFLRRQSGTVNL